MSLRDERFERMRQVLALRRPDRLPCGDYRMVEYRPDVYHLGDAEPLPPAGQVGLTRDGRRKVTRDGGVWAVDAREKYRDESDVLNADPERFAPEEVGEAMRAAMARQVAAAAETHFPVPMHYGTLVTRATIEFGWEPFLTALALDPRRFGRLLDQMGEASLRVATGWARTEGVELIAIHDDIAGTRGLLIGPEWLREYVFPWYARIFQAIHAEGRKVLYICDGDYAPALDDLLPLEPDGLYVESSSMDPAAFLRRAGRDRLYLIKTNSQNVDFGTPEEIRAELAALRDLHQEFPGMMIYRGGGRPGPGNAEAFQRAYEELLVYR